MPVRAREIGFGSLTAVALLAACGGKVVVDGGGAGGGGSTTAAVTTGVGGTASGGGGGSSCATLLADFEAKLAAAEACDPTVNSPQCTGMSVVLDTCGCTAVAGEGHPDAVSVSGLAYAQWTGAGCGPFDCDHCPPPPDSPWYCDSSSKKCMPAYEK